MSRKEDFEKAAEDYCEDHSHCIYFEAGAEYGYQYAVEKVYAFLVKYAANFVALPDEGQQPIGDTNAIYGTKSLLHYLRKAMEE